MAAGSDVRNPGRSVVVPRRRRRFDELAGEIRARVPRRGSTRVVAVDGGSGAGKTTVAARLAAALGAPVVHTDDVAWFESRFAWWPLLIERILDPLAEGRDVRWRPPAWQARGRRGAIVVPWAGSVVVEGVGAGRRELGDFIDVLVWVDTDRQRARQRALQREGDTPESFDAWMTEEVPHLAADRPWERADLLVSNDDGVSQDAVVVIDASTWTRTGRG